MHRYELIPLRLVAHDIELRRLRVPPRAAPSMSAFFMFYDTKRRFHRPLAPALFRLLPLKNDARTRTYDPVARDNYVGNAHGSAHTTRVIGLNYRAYAVMIYQHYRYGMDGLLQLGSSSVTLFFGLSCQHMTLLYVGIFSSFSSIFHHMPCLSNNMEA